MIRKLIVIVIFALASVTFYLFYICCLKEYGDSGKTYSIVVRPGDNGVTLFESLRKDFDADVDRKIFLKIMEKTETDRKLKPGLYKFSGGQSCYDLVLIFRDGIPELSRVTIPEGLTVNRVVPLLAAQVPCDSLELRRLLKDRQFFGTFGIEAPGFEGYLFPETYTFSPYLEPRAVIAEMVETFKKNLTAELSQRAAQLFMTTNEVTTLASMIEAEATVDSEYATISSVFHNRLRKRWKLQCDPTVIFALGGLDRPLQRRDLEIKSPYNTYQNFGLPPGPICSPGLGSIKAALYPASTNYFYFVASGDGSHVFTRTLAEHNRAALAIKKKLRAFRQLQAKKGKAERITAPAVGK